ncbi:glutathione-dependent formaldehyde-activating enzyme [Mycena albidolilacea]|uniref:Glutathione-dependent formaldehyde-activating enzyme n=1 Tax=Mycena albidolilacea TaxID=1033008 RepID=A0AAD6ZZ97_9AGAR|nr:glutathione-dependent formaldehyde-activating enzyme [Mycena albidolilacea]
MSETPKPIEYRGNCHCGAFKFTFKTPPLEQGLTCSCSICSKNGYMWAIPASNEDLTVVKGDENALKSYHFNKGTLAHKFCPTCGTSVMARNSDGKCLINIRALADVDLWSLPVRLSDGAATGPPYNVPAPVEVRDVPEGSTVYSGSCHCGAVGYTLVSPEKITTATDCDCSICSRDGALWIYPQTSAVTFKGLDSLVEYTFGTKTTFHGFCKNCGVAIRERFDPPQSSGTALNVRTINGLDLSTLQLEKEDGKSMLPPYEM